MIGKKLNNDEIEKVTGGDGGGAYNNQKYYVSIYYRGTKNQSKGGYISAYNGDGTFIFMVENTAINSSASIETFIYTLTNFEGASGLRLLNSATHEYIYTPGKDLTLVFKADGQEVSATHLRPNM